MSRGKYSRLNDEPEDLGEAIRKGRIAWPPMSRRRKVAFAFAGVSLAAMIGVWTQRHGIAENFVEAELSKRDVEASYVIDDIGFSTQRLTDLVIGDPARPDLVADWVEVQTRVDFGGIEVTGIRAGQVRLRGRLVDGKLALGEIDKMLPPPSGKPFALPAIGVEVADARMRLETPYGLVGVKLAGAGRLNDGFSGRAAAVSERLEIGNCVGERMATTAAISIEDARPSLKGPLRAASFGCGEAQARFVEIALDATLGEALDRWRGNARVEVQRASLGAQRVDGIGGTISFSGRPQATTGEVDLTSRGFAVEGVSGAALSVDGRYQAGTRGLVWQGGVGARAASLQPASVRRIASSLLAAKGTPVAPLADELGRALVAAGRRFDFTSEIEARLAGGAGEFRLARLDTSAASGARATVSDGRGVRYAWGGEDRAGMTLDGLLTMSGGGLPQGVVRVSQAAPFAPVTGTAILSPYAANGAALAMTPVDFSATADGRTRITTRATLSGPFSAGRVDGLVMPIDARWGGGTALTVNPGCVLVAFQRLEVSALTLDPSRMTVCPEGSAMVRLDGRAMSGGMRLANTRLGGRLGGTPVTIAAQAARYFLADNRFALSGVETRLGASERVSRLDIADLDGRVVGGRIDGSYAGGAGQIGNVPLLLSEAAGDWSLADGLLSVGGTLMVADAAPDPRFVPLRGENVALTLRGNDIRATGVLVHPDKRVKVADVDIVHDLGTGAGEVDLDVTGISFGEDFQPEELTRLTFGVIADVQGAIAGDARIAWSPDAVTSTGVFATEDMDLAAAFGPVEGISGKIEFTDLLNLVSAPSQSAAIAVVNPGIAVENGIVRYQLVGDQKVQVLGGEWPLAGGRMILEPTLLDFSQTTERRMTFRVEGVDAAQFVQQFEFDNLLVTGTFDGVLPMIFDARGGRIEGGELVARDGGGNVAYVGEISQENLGTWGNMAFDALKSLDYENLTINIDGPIAGEMVTAIRFAGVSQGEGASSNFITRRLARLPIIFNIRVKAPFRQLLDSVRSYYDPRRLIERNLPALLDAQERQQQPDNAPDAVRPETETGEPVQPPESEEMP